MINIAILLNIPKEYKGGINYYKNLLLAISTVNENKLFVNIFTSKDMDQEYLDEFSKYAKVIKTNVLTRKTFTWFIDRMFFRLFKISLGKDLLLIKNNIDIVSHSYHIPKLSKAKSINWIPDFQYVYYPNLWTKKQLDDTVKLHDYLVDKSNVIMLSSNDAKSTYLNEYTKYKDKVKVIHFVSQPETAFELLEKNLSEHVVDEYTQGKPFFYLPNQFWSHKNHIVVFKAAKILKDKGYDFKLITSGLMHDFRSGDQHINMLKKFVEEYNLSDVIIFLGLIPYNQVLNLILYSKSLINPSFFEGWSSTVEEAKTLGSMVILSNIGVHIEQCPANSLYFDPLNENELAKHMEDVLNNNIFIKQFTLDELKSILNLRMSEFGRKYLSLVTQIHNN